MDHEGAREERGLTMPFEKGNTHGAKSRMFDAALKRAILQDDGKRLRQAAEALLTAAAEGEAWAIAQLADRLDGKAGQSVSIEHKNVTDLSLTELAAEMAAAIAGGGEPASAGADGDQAVH